MSTLRISNIEAKSVPASATTDEKIKITNSSGDVLVFLDGKTSGITTVGINTTDGNITFDANSNVVVTGIITATKFVGAFEPTDLPVSGDLSISDKIIHIGDTNTAIRFPAADTFSVETAGSTRLHIHSDGRFRVGCTAQPSGTVGGFQLDMGSYPGTLRLMSGAGASGTQSASVNIGGSNHHADLHNGSNVGASLSLFNYNTTDGNSTGVSYHNSNSLAIARILGVNISHSNRHGALVFMTSNGTHPVEQARIDNSGHMSLGYAGSPASSNGNVTKKFGIRSTQNNVLIGETSATSEHTGFIFEARQTGRSGNARIAQINMGNDAGADGRIKFSTAPDNADVQERFRISNNGIRSYATLVDTSYHANPDPFGDGSGIVYYRLNDNFHDHGIFAQHATGKDGGDPTFALVNSTGEKCWQNPVDGAIQIPNLKNSYPFSMACWINLSVWPTTSNNDVIMNLDIGNQRVTLCIVKWADRTTSDPSIMYGGSSHWIFPASSRPTNTWIHLVYSVVGSNNSGHAVYQNGSALSAIDKGGGHGGSAGWRLGGNANNTERFAIGRIGSIRFFNKAISSSEASALYTNDKFYT